MYILVITEKDVIFGMLYFANGLAGRQNMMTEIYVYIFAFTKCMFKNIRRFLLINQRKKYSI